MLQGVNFLFTDYCLESHPLPPMQKCLHTLLNEFQILESTLQGRSPHSSIGLLFLNTFLVILSSAFRITLIIFGWIASIASTSLHFTVLFPRHRFLFFIISFYPAARIISLEWKPFYGIPPPTTLGYCLTPRNVQKLKLLTRGSLWTGQPLLLCHCLTFCPVP